MRVHQGLGLFSKIRKQHPPPLDNGRGCGPSVGAEVIFTAQSTFEQSEAFRDDIRARAVVWGRDPDHIKVVPGAIGTVEDIVDQLQQWFQDGACDGFNFLPAVNPLFLEDGIYKVVPELRRRGLCRSEHEGRTLREPLGISAAPLPLPS